MTPVFECPNCKEIFYVPDEDPHAVKCPKCKVVVVSDGSDGDHDGAA